MAIAPDSSSAANLSRARLTTAMFCVGLAIALSICYGVVQPDVLRGFEQVRNTVAVSVCLLLLPQGYREIQRWLNYSNLRPQRNLPQADIGLDALVTLLGLISLVGLSWLSLHLSISLAPFFWVLALILLGISVWRWVPDTLEREHLIVGAIVIIFYVYLACMIWGTGGYMTPRPIAKLLSGTLHIDTLFHSSIAGMIRTYGIPSTGLDGPVYLPYHIGSHWLFAQLSSLVDLTTFRFYNLAYPILILPLFFRSILAFAVDLRCFGTSISSTWDLRKDWIFWSILVICFVGFLPTALILKLGITLMSPMISQSHLLALSLSFFTLCLCLRLTDQITSQADTGNHSLSTVLLICIISILLSLVSLSKVSIGFLLFSLLFYIIVRLRLYLQWPVGLGLGGAIFLQFLALKYMGYFGGYPTTSIPVELFAYLKEYVDPSVRVFSLPVLFIWAATYIMLRFRAMKLYTVADLAKASRTGTTIDVEILIFVCLLGLTPGLLLRIAGGSAYYFMDFQMWLSLGLLLGAAYSSTLWQSLANLKARL